MNPDANSKLNLIAYGENSARMNSKLRIVDNSFNFPGSYFRFNDDQFYLSEKTDENYYNNYLDVFISTSSAGIHRRKNRENYYLSNSNTEPISFKFLNFDASSEIIHSYISYNGQIYLKPLAISTIRLDATNAKSAKEIKIDLPIITVNSEGVSCTAKLNNVIIDLEKWKIEANHCEVSAEKGGLYSTNAKIVTGNLDIQLSEFNLRSDFIYLGKPNLTTLPLGSVSNINIESGAKTFFGFDPRCGNDLAPHYKLTICNESTAGYIKNIPGIYRLDFQAISLISNGEPPIISFAPNSQSIDLFRLVKFRPFTIEAYKDAFTINGALDFNLPRIPNGINYKLEYSKASTASDISFRLLPSNVIFNAPGYTKFESIAGKDEQFLGPNQVKLFGQISEPGKLEPIKVVLTKTIDNGFFPVVDYSIAKNNDFGEQYIKLSQNNDKFQIINADMKAKNNDWDLLRLKLKPMGNFADSGFGTKEINFAVFGDVKTDPEVKDQAIEPPPSGGTQLSFGGFDMIFSLNPEPTFFGSMNIPQKSFGAVKFAGTAEILIDKHGFYFVGAGMGNITPLGEFGVGLLIGNYTKGGAFGGISPSAISKVTQYSIGKGLPCAFENANTFQGLFFTGRKSIPMLCYNESVNLVIAAASVHTDAGLEASAWFNFGGESISGGVSMMLYAIAELQMTSISCTDLSARAEGLVKATGSFEGTNVNMDLCASINIFGKLEQRVPALFGCGPLIFSLGSSSDPLLSLKALIGLSNSGFNCSLEKGSCNSNCSSSFK